MRSKCKSCGAEVVFIQSAKSDASLICDAGQIIFVPDDSGTETLTTGAGNVYTKVRTDVDKYADRGARLIGYRSHWATCPTRNQHRKEKQK